MLVCLSIGICIIWFFFSLKKILVANANNLTPWLISIVLAFFATSLLSGYGAYQLLQSRMCEKSAGSTL